MNRWIAILAMLLVTALNLAAMAQEEGTPSLAGQTAAADEREPELQPPLIAGANATGPQDNRGPENAAQEDTAQEPSAAPEAGQAITAQPSSCVTCHGESDLWEGERRRFFMTEADLSNDIHWQKGIQCHDCHGGDPSSMSFSEAHAVDAGYRAIASPKDIPQFCGHCHSDVEYMTRFGPSPKTNQVADYWTGGHGKRLQESPNSNVANCVSCHGRHGIRAIDDQESPTYPTNVAKMCATCHSDAEKMAGIQYHDRPIGHDQYDLWSTSVHAEMLLEKGDLSAPTCNDCHGNHGAVAPDATSVASACATCHGKIGELFETTVMKHRFQQINLPGCATCHGSHAIQRASDEMLGMEQAAVCSTCHVGGKFGAPIDGAYEAKAMRDALLHLQEQIEATEEKLETAERLGMEVRRAKFRLRDAHSALANARVEIHSFAMEPLQKAIAVGSEISEEVDVEAEKALREHTFRRIWLSFSLVPIGIVAVLLILVIRTLPPPTIVDLHH